MHLRVTVEGLGYVGLVELLSASTTLSQLRALLAQTFDADALPPFYQFLAPGGATIGMRAEPATLAWSLRPSITLLPTSESPLAGALRRRGLAHERAARPSRAPAPPHTRAPPTPPPPPPCPNSPRVGAPVE